MGAASAAIPPPNVFNWADSKRDDDTVWQYHVHDRALRYGESLHDAAFYIINSPARASLIERRWHCSLLTVDSAIAAEAAPTDRVEFPQAELGFPRLS